MFVPEQVNGEALASASTATGGLIVMLVGASHILSDITFTVYVPALNPVNNGLFTCVFNRPPAGIVR
ncbi:hypothetical protein D3C85_1000700 [compost metagenome]